MRALLSVSAKEGIVDFARGLLDLGWEIVSTGGTALALTEAGLPVVEVTAVTGFPEILDGRVKTLHPHLHGGILARRDRPEHQAELIRLGIKPIDLVAVNLYPFRATVEKPGVAWDEIIENIDIGGPTLLRAAAKNYRQVIVVVDPRQYPRVLAALRGPGLKERERFVLALEAFRHTAFYDAVIASYLGVKGEEFYGQEAEEGLVTPASGAGISREIMEGEAGLARDGRTAASGATAAPSLADPFPNYLTIPLEKIQDLRYGENPHQAAALYWWPGRQRSFKSIFRQLQGKELSFNNLNDAEAALSLVAEFPEPAAVAIKHANPCGVGVGADLVSAYQKAYAADPVSIFGGIIAFNREVQAELAQMVSQIFLEVLVAPRYSPEALEILKKKKDLRLLEIREAPLRSPDRDGRLEEGNWPKMDSLDPLPWACRKITGGFLLQEQDLVADDPATWRRVAGPEQPGSVITDLLFALRVVKHARSNAIVVAQDGQTLGIGSGQTNRIDAARQALERALSRREGKLERAVLASDAFFPFPDVVEAASQAGIKAIVQPGGSVRDQESISLAEKLNITMYFTGRRHFRH